MKHVFQLTILFALCATLFTAFPSEVSAQPDWVDFADWDPITFSGDFADYTGSHLRYGPVIADFEGDGMQEIIITGAKTIGVYSADDPEDAVLSIDLSQDLIGQGYLIRSAPSVGDVNGDGTLDLVYTIVKDHVVFYDVDQDEIIDFRETSYYTEVYVYNGSTGQLIDSVTLPFFKGNTPALVDVDVLDYDPQNPCYEDGRMEIIFAGIRSILHDIHDEGHETISWALNVVQLSDQNELRSIDVATISSIDHKDTDWIDNVGGPSAAVNIQSSSYLIPAVGDMDNDGKKEIVMSFPIGYKCWTFFDHDNSDQTNNLIEQFDFILRDPQDDSSDDHPPFDDSRGFHDIGRY